MSTTESQLHLTRPLSGQAVTDACGGAGQIPYRNRRSPSVCALTLLCLALASGGSVSAQADDQADDQAGTQSQANSSLALASGASASAQDDDQSDDQDDDQSNDQDGAQSRAKSSFASPQDTTKRVTKAHTGKDNLIDFPALEGFYKKLDGARANVHKSTGMKGVFFHSTVYQFASDSLPGQDDYGVATITGLYGTWDAVDKANPSAGQFSFGLEARWGYGDRLTPVELGTAGIGSATGTVDPYGEQSRTTVLREAFWHQGSPQQGWNYRIGKITPDRLLTSSDHIDPVSLFFPVGSGGAPSIAFPDSGFGAAAGLFPSDKFRVGVVVADAAGDRTNMGDIGQGNFFKAIEAQVQLFKPLTEKGGYSTFTLWHTDGTDDPEDAKDSSTGASGWGYFIKLEKELTSNGKNIGMIRFGKSFDDSAVYKEQGSIRYVRLDPADPFGLGDDHFGIAVSYVKPIVNPFDRDEWGIDMFYRFNLVDRVQFSFGYQVIFDPTFNPDDDTINVFSLRLTQFF